MQLPTLRWDTLEDFVIYGLIMLGLIISPTTIFNGTPLYCTPCISVSWLNYHQHHKENQTGSYCQCHPNQHHHELSRHHIVISAWLTNHKNDFHNFHNNLSHKHGRPVNVGTSQAVGTPQTTTRGGSKPFAHTVHLVRKDLSSNLD